MKKVIWILLVCAAEAALNYTDFAKCVRANAVDCIELYFGAFTPFVVKHENDTMPSMNVTAHCRSLVTFFNCMKKPCGDLPYETLEDFWNINRSCDFTQFGFRNLPISFGIQNHFSLVFFSIIFLGMILFV